MEICNFEVKNEQKMIYQINNVLGLYIQKSFELLGLTFCQNIFSGMMYGLYGSEYIQVEYALSGRARCRGCNQLIEKDTLRIGNVFDVDQQIHSVKWHHLPCHRLTKGLRNINPKNEYLLSRIATTDQAAVIKHLERQKQRLNQPKRIPSQASYSQEKEESSPEESSPEESSLKKSSHEENSLKKVQEVKQPKNNVETKKPEKKKKLKKEKPSAGYSAQQKEEFRRLFKEYMKKSVAELKEELIRNFQTKTGIKDVLAERCADGRILGQIPLCQNCGGGRPKFDSKTGTYTCRGYLKDDDFINCHSTFSMDEIKRSPWV